MIGVNRVGTAKSLRYDGGSVGRSTRSALRLVEGGAEDAVLVAEISTVRVTARARASFRSSSDRR